MARTVQSESLAILECSRPPATDDTKIEVNVVFTTHEGTVMALRTAASLARDLDARIRFLVHQTVPFVLPLEAPPVYVSFIERRCRAMARGCAGASEVNIEVYLCRDRQRAVLQTLRPHALVVLGGKRSWWPSSEQKLARQLHLHGHHVIFAAQLGLRQARPKDEEVLRRLAAQKAVPVFIGRCR
jgi:hypothetical protein